MERLETAISNFVRSNIPNDTLTISSARSEPLLIIHNVVKTRLNDFSSTVPLFLLELPTSHLQDQEILAVKEWGAALNRASVRFIPELGEHSIFIVVQATVGVALIREYVRKILALTRRGAYFVSMASVLS